MKLLLENWRQYLNEDTNPLEIEDYEGEYGNKRHMTRTVRGVLPVKDLLNLKGKKGEHEAFIYNPTSKTYSRNPDSKHAPRYDQEKWDNLVRSIRVDGFNPRYPIFIVSDPGIGPKVSEGNHRIRAAHEAGLTHIPVEIRYFGHSERNYRVSDKESPTKAYETPKGPEDFFYEIIKSPKKITINVLDMDKNPVDSKKKDTKSFISMEKRTDVPNWEVSWSSSPLNSIGVGTIMYLMALELADEGLSPDSYETSPEARRVWDKFMKNPLIGVKKELKDGHEGEDETDPFNYVFFKTKKGILDKYNHEIIEKEAKKDEKTGFDPEKEEEIEQFDPETFDWEELDDLDEQTEPYQIFSKGTYKKFINKLGKQGPNKYNVGKRMRKPSTKHLKSGPPGG